jgi:hypothetical protein
VLVEISLGDIRIHAISSSPFTTFHYLQLRRIRTDHMHHIPFLAFPSHSPSTICMSTNSIKQLGQHSRYSNWLRLDDRGVGVPSPGRVKNFLFSTSSRPALGPTQPPIEWVPGVLSQGVKRGGVKLTTHLQLVPRSRKCGSIHQLLHMPSWRSA